MERLLRLCRHLRDRARGYGDEDVRSLQQRFQGLALWAEGATIWLTEAETKVLAAGHVIGVWRVNTLAVNRGRARVKLSRSGT